MWRSSSSDTHHFLQRLIWGDETRTDQIKTWKRSAKTGDTGQNRHTGSDWLHLIFLTTFWSLSDFDLCFDCLHVEKCLSTIKGWFVHTFYLRLVENTRTKCFVVNITNRPRSLLVRSGLQVSLVPALLLLLWSHAVVRRQNTSLCPAGKSRTFLKSKRHGC